MIAEMSVVATPLLPVSVAKLGSGSSLVYLHDVHFDLVSAAGEPPRFVELLAQSHAVYAPALPGFRDLKELAAVESVLDYVELLADLLVVLGLDRPHVVGTGLGGWLAAELAVQHPDVLRSLTLINAFGLRVEGHPIARFFDAGAANPLGGRREIRELLFTDPDNAPGIEALSDHPDDDVNEQYFKHMHAAARIGWTPPAFYNPRLLPRLGRITVPTHVVWADDDKVVDSEHARAYESGIADSTVTIIEGAGHAITLEQPDDLAKAVGTYIDQHES